MLKFVTGAILGGIIMAGILIPVIFDQRKEKLALGYKMGIIKGELSVIEFLGKYFESALQKHEKDYINQFNCKERAVFIIRENGKITLKIR